MILRHGSRAAAITLLLSICVPSPAQKFQFDASKPAPPTLSVDVPEGNYRVAIAFGAAKTATDTTVKAELRRLMLEHVRTEPGQFVRRDFVVNVRTPVIAGGGEVSLKDRERASERAAWDHQLSLEFLGTTPGVASVIIEPAPGVPTLFLAGDSTVTDQPLELYASWGQMIPRFFGPDIAVANHSESGESLTSFIAEGRLRSS